MNTAEIQKSPAAPDIDFFAPETVSGKAEASAVTEVFRDKAGNILSAERVWELSFVRSVRPDGTAVDGLDRPVKRHFI